MSALDGHTPVEIELTMRFELPDADVWPDGLPETIDAAAVIVAVEKSTTVREFINDWDADTFGAEVYAHVNGQAARGWLR